MRSKNAADRARELLRRNGRGPNGTEEYSDVGKNAPGNSLPLKRETARVVTLSDVTPEKVRWLWEERRIGVPPRSEDHRHLRIGLLDDRLDVDVAAGLRRSSEFRECRAWLLKS